MNDKENQAGAEEGAAEAHKRIGIAAACGESLALILRANKDKDIRTRTTDQMSAWILRISIFVSVFLIALSMIFFSKEAMLCYFLADLAFFVGVAIYVLNRFGILRLMSPRHALVCWQLVCGSSLLAVGIAINVLFFAVWCSAGSYFWH